MGATQSLCYAEFSIYTGRDSYIIDDANAKEVFFGLRDDIEKLALGQYFCALAAELAPEMEPAGDFLRVVLNSLHLLEKQMRSCRFLKAVTELKLLSLAGFMPDLTVCRHCEKAPSGDMAFNVREGCLYCRGSGKTGLVISAGGAGGNAAHLLEPRGEDLFVFAAGAGRGKARRGLRKIPFGANRAYFQGP